MPHFFLHIRNGFGFAEDEEGQDLPGIDEAHKAAIEGARSLLSEEVEHGSLDLRGQIEVMDPEGSLLEVVRFSDVIHIRTGELPPEREQGGFE